MFAVGITRIVLLFVFCLLLTTATACIWKDNIGGIISAATDAAAALNGVIDKNINSIFTSHDWQPNENLRSFLLSPTAR